jgi:protein N-lysine methyltransferase METTL21A
VDTQTGVFLLTRLLVRGTHALARTKPACGWWLRRLGHQLSDVWTVLAFSAPSALSSGASLSVSGVTIKLEQWSGYEVGSGGYLWDASRRLANYFEHHGVRVPASKKLSALPSEPLQGLTLLELGAGTGGLGLAASVLGADVTITDQGSFCFPGRDLNPTALQHRTLLDLVLCNIQQNRGVVPKAPVVVEMQWGHGHEARVMASLPHKTYDILCGADILLFQSAHADLVQTLRSLSKPSTVVLIEHTDRSSDPHDYPYDLQNFLKAVIADGLWSATVVRDLGRHLTVRMVRE